MHNRIPFFLFVILLAGCVSQTNTNDTVSEPVEIPEIPERGFFMGFLPIPKKGQSFENAYYEASRFCDFVPVWGKPSPFYALADDLAGDWGKIFVDTYIKENNMFPLIHFSFIGEQLTLKNPPGMNATLKDPEWRDLYKKSILEVVTTEKPHYLSLGNEVNRWYEKYGYEGLNGFQHYITLHEEIYDAVKEVSPETTVFCTFSREIVSENREADLTVLNLFNPQKMDILVFTTYPYAVQGINSSSDIPNDYYTRALQYMPGKPLAFSEVAWASLDAFGGEKGQADFLRDLCGRLTIDQGINLLFVGWSWLCDLAETDSTGLVYPDGTEKQAYTVWKELYQ